MNKKIFFLLNSNNEYIKLIHKFISNFSDHDIELYFWSETKKVFYFKDTEVKIEDRLIFADSVVNLLPKKSLIYREIGQKLEKLKLIKYQNSLATDLLFSQKSNVKKILSRYGLKTPFFERINDKTPVELFSNFPQPSRIFSKENGYFSDKLENINDINDIFKHKFIKISDYYMEEFVEGDDVYILLFRNDDGLHQYSISPDPDSEIPLMMNAQINSILKTVFNDLGIEKYAIFHLKYGINENIYFLNIFTDINIFAKFDNNIIDKIFEKYDLKLWTIFK